MTYDPQITKSMLPNYQKQTRHEMQNTTQFEFGACIKQKISDPKTKKPT